MSALSIFVHFEIDFAHSCSKVSKFDIFFFQKIEGIKLVSTSESDLNTSSITADPLEMLPVTTMASTFEATSQDDFKYRLFPNNSLLISPVEEEDIGDYKCKVTNIGEYLEC